MPLWWLKCSVCGPDFSSTDPTRTDCGNAKRHAEQNKPKKR